MSKITILTPEDLIERDKRQQRQQPARPDETPRPSAPPTGIFGQAYPNIALFVAEYGYIEVGYDDGPLGFIRALDAGGMIWEGEASYPSVDAAFDDLEQAIGAWLDEEMPDAE